MLKQRDKTFANIVKLGKSLSDWFEPSPNNPQKPLSTANFSSDNPKADTSN
ncbi:hypothetical protein N9087_00255 [bacterium]|nr:hypothetical protein [bacterium]